MPSEHINSTSVLVDSLIGFYTLEPLLHELAHRGILQHLYCRSNILGRVRELFPQEGVEIHSLEPLAKAERRILYLHRFLRQLATRADFSFQYRLLSDPRQFAGDWRYWVTAKLAALSPGMPHKSVNGALDRVVGKLVRNHFQTRRLLTVSRSAFPHLLCSQGLEVITILESWDHPVKWPVGHRSSAVFTWNNDLAQDWIEYQGDKEVFVAYPFKLRYWLKKNLPERPLGGMRVAVYAVGTSSMSYINEIHRSELKVIDAVCEATRRAGWRLVIKPKPNGKAGDFDRFTARYPHVGIGMYRDAGSPTDYYLDDNYNLRREIELAEGDLLINSVTTFVLDAALGGVPCLQLDLRCCPEFKGISEAQTNHHISRYLLNDKNCCLVAEPRRLVEQLTEFLIAPDSRPERQRNRLRAWLQPKQSLDEAVAFIVDRLLAPSILR
jgi:hypothetical protein